MATQFDGAFNDIGLVDLIIQTPMGNLTAKNSLQRICLSIKEIVF